MRKRKTVELEAARHHRRTRLTLDACDRVIEAGASRERRTRSGSNQLMQNPGAPGLSDATIYYNGACPICRHEIGLYSRSAKKQSAPLRFIDISTAPGSLTRAGISDDNLRRRLHTRLPDGRIVSGLDSFIEIYSHLTHFRWLAVVLRLPGLRHLAALAYDKVAVPLLAAYNRRRKMDSFAGG